MKKLLALALVVFGLAACQTEPEGINVDANGEAAVTLTVALPDDATRAAGADSAKGAIGNVDMSKYDIRYILEVYDEDGRLAKNRMVETSDETSATFSFRLVPGRPYNFVVWADFVLNGTEADLHYNTNEGNGGLRKVEVIKTQWDVIDESRDAYTDVVTVHNFSSAADIPTITLTRPFAKLRVVTNDIKEMISIRPAEVKVEYISTKFRDTFDAFTETATGEYEVGALTATLLDSQQNPVDVYSGGLDAEDGVQTLFADYFFGAEDDRVMFTMDVKDNGGRDLPQVTFNTNIPVKRNNLTTVYGPVLTDSNNITVTIDDAFENGTNWNPEDDKYDVELISGTKTETVVLKAGKYVFDDVTIKVADGNAIEVEGDVVIDVMGVMTLDSKGGIVVKNGSLVINGVVETRGAERAGILKVETEEGSAIGGSNITIQNLAGLTAKANGEHAFGIGAENATVVIKNTKIDYVAGGYIQPLWVNDTKYGKSEPQGGAAIGGANVTIENSEIVKAEGGSKAAAIGNKYWADTNIVIMNSTLGDIFGGNASAAIGGSRYSSDISADNKQTTKIKIENSTITNAVGGQAGAGIGSGYDTHCTANNSNAVNEIVITNSTIKAQGGKYAAGIGTGFHAAALTGSIDAASTIDATRGEDFYKGEYTTAQNIGYGVVDPAREFKGAVVTFTVAGETIAHPLYAGYEKMNDGAYFDEANNKYYITNAAGLKWVADVVNATTPYTATIFDEAVVELSNDIDLNNEEWIPIGDDRSQRTEWHGVFDGKGYTVKNVKITKKTDRDDENKSSYGLFGNVKGTVKNLTVENVSISGAPKFIGALIGRLNDGLVENCHVKSSSVECNNWTIGGLVGQLNNGKISGCSVEGTTIKGYAAVGAIAGIALNSGERTIENCSVKNCSIVKNGSFGGDFDKMFGAVLGAVYSGSLTVYINGCSVESTTVLGEVSSTIFGHATEGDQVFVDGVCFTPTSVATADALVEALENGESVLFEDDVKIEPAGMSNAYGTTGINVKNGQTIDGGGHILDIKGAGGTWDSGISTTGGMIKNITVTGSFRGIFINHNSENCSKVYLDNVIIDGTTYTISCDQGTNNGLEATNSTFKGWTSYAATLGNAKFTDCYFGKGNGNAYCRPYAPTEFVGCEFEAGFRLDPRADVTFENCTFGGVALTDANIADLVTNTAKVTIK